MDVQKIPKGPLFHIFRHYGTYWRLQKNFEKKIGNFFFNFFFIISTARLLLGTKKIAQRFRVHFFWSFAAEWMLKIPKGPPFSFFGIVRLFSIFFSPKGPPSIFLTICYRRDKKCQSFPLAPQFGPTFGFLGCFRREYFDTLKSFCYF